MAENEKKKVTKDHPIFAWAKFSSKQFSRITDLELAVLKIHLVIEEALRYLLEARLRVSEGSLDKLKLRVNFDTKCKLALVGLGYVHLFRGIQALNKARNALAHSVESADVQKQLAIFVKEIGCMRKQEVDWPESPSEQLNVLKDAFDETANAILDRAFAFEQK